MDMPFTRVLPDSCYAEASDLIAANASLPLEQRTELLMKFFEDKEKELKAGSWTEVLGDMDHQNDGGICELECGSDELVQCSVEGEVGSCIKDHGTSVSVAELVELAQCIQEEIKEGHILDNESAFASIKVMACLNEKAGGMGKHLPHNKRGLSPVEGELECKKGRMAESSPDIGEEPLLQGVSTVDA